MSASPMMQQYHQARAACGDAILLFRMGDFYELFFDDAKTAARVLGLTLTSRDKGADPIPMAGFPHHQLDGYLSKLISAGYRAAVCEQVEDPKQAKGLVKREVTRVVSPGTVTDDALLDPRESNFLAAIAPDGKPRAGEAETVGLAWVDLSTGLFQAATVPPAALRDELARLAPAECLVSEEAPPPAESLTDRAMITARPAWAFNEATAREKLLEHFSAATLEGFGFDDQSDAAAIRAAGAVLDYLQETQKASLDHIDRISPYRAGDSLEIDESTRRSLELTRSLREGGRQGTLLAVLDRAVTAMGSRTLGGWLAAPLTDIEQIDARLNAVAELVEHTALCDDLRDALAEVYDLERLLARVTTGRASPRDLSFVARTLRALPKLKAKLTARKAALLRDLEDQLDLCVEIRSQLDAALVDDCPLSATEGGVIRPGYRKQLDELRGLAAGGKQWIAEYQAGEVERLDIPSLKVGYNKVFGYYLEVTHAHRDKVPENYIRKQTLKNAERYVTPELKEYEEKVVAADDKARTLEYDLFVELRAATQAESRRLRATASVLARLDALAALAALARQRGYCRPQIVAEPILEIDDGRHPALDVLLAEGEFVPNDTRIGRGRPAESAAKPGGGSAIGDADDGAPAEASDAEHAEPPDHGVVHLITGPNMAGKSTYIRQVALITVMAQMGSFVPARRATIGVADRVFARVGASDELARGQSTFMVEMTETARILNNATERSLVILDEIGRGTSTYDGVSLAWAIVEHLHDAIGCRTLFATHYHELTDLAGSLAGVRNLNVAVREWQDDVVFLHKITPGSADKSYGIHVARLAGVPRPVNERAKQILAQLESEHLDENGRPKIARKAKRPQRDVQLTLFAPVEHPLLDELRQTDVDSLRPLDALALLDRWREQLRAEREDGG